MRRKHFRALAEAIKSIENHNERIRMADLIGIVCSEYNNRFNWSRWRTACGV